MENFLTFLEMIAGLLGVYLLLSLYVHFFNVEYKSDVCFLKNKYSVNISRNNSFSCRKIKKYSNNDDSGNLEIMNSNKIDNNSFIVDNYKNKSQDNENVMITIDNNVDISQKDTNKSINNNENVAMEVNMTEIDICDTLNQPFSSLSKSEQARPSQSLLPQQIQQQELEIRLQM